MSGLERRGLRGRLPHQDAQQEAFDHSGLIYGLGHAVYTKTDPRCEVFRDYVHHLAAEKGRRKNWPCTPMWKRSARQLLMERQHKKALSTNIDFYSGFVYEMLGLPMELYTPSSPWPGSPAGAPTGWRSSPWAAS